MRKLCALAVALTVTLAGCAAQEAIPQPHVGKESTDIVSIDRYQTFADETSKAIAQADAALDAAKLGNRVAQGPLRTQRTGQYAVKKALRDDYALDAIVINQDSVPVSSGSAFPRTLMAFAGPQENENLSTLSVWTQDTPRSNYQIWAEVEIFPGVSVPAIVSNESDVEGYSENDASKYVVDPAKVLPEYVSYNTKRKQASIPFTANDTLYTKLAAQQDTLAESIGELGSVKTTFTATDTPIKTVSTTDGGLIVVGEMNYSVEIAKVKESATLRISGEIGAVAPGNKDRIVTVTNPLIATYSTTVGFYVPPKGGSDEVKVIGSSIPALIKVAKKES